MAWYLNISCDMDYKYLFNKEKRIANLQSNTGLLERCRFLFSRKLASILAGLLLLFILIHFAKHHSTPTKAPSQSEQQLLPLPNEQALLNAVTTSQPVVPVMIKTAASKPTPAPVKPSNKLLTYQIKAGDTLSGIFSQLKIPQKNMLEIIHLTDAKKYLTRLIPGGKLDFELTPNLKVKQLSYPLSIQKKLIVSLDGDHYVGKWINKPLKKKNIHATATIDSSLTLAGQQANIPHKIVMQLADIFSWRINFARDLRKGDTFTVVYQKSFVEGKPVNSGTLLAAELNNHGKTYRAVRYEAKNGIPGYFTPEGKSLEKAFLRTPVKYRRVSSSFNPQRTHPVLKIRRPHYGVDLAAPAGTPVHAAGDGIVSFSGRRGGYGNLITLSHGQQITTRYAHLQRTAAGIKRGKSVRRGQIIAYVGSTGLATGPHLHYEYRIKNRPYNPLTVKMSLAKKIDTETLADFQIKTSPLLAQLDVPTTYAENSSASQPNGRG